MKIFVWKTFLIGIFVLNLITAFLMWSYLETKCDCTNFQQKYSSYIHKINEDHRMEINIVNDSEVGLHKKVLFIFREFEYFENDLLGSVMSIINVLPTAKVLIISDKMPYPPLQFPEEVQQKIQTFHLKTSLNKPVGLQQPLNIIEQEHIFIFPDSVRVQNISQIMKMLQYHYYKPKSIIAAPVEGENSFCLSLNISLRHWTMKYYKNIGTHQCNALDGMHVLLIPKALLLHLAYPFARPFSISLHMQATLLKIKTELLPDISFKKGRILFSDAHSKWKHNMLEVERKQKLYSDFGIKKIIYPASRVEWYGCNKNTARCFGTVFNNMPEYLFEGRWTPPCCLENLRQTARYVFSILEKCEVRYWLEGGSLLGAVRNGDIIPWDYDVDIGIYKDDIKKCEWLKNSLQQSIIDTQGFVWEKAREGDFIRVQFSQSNHLHVDIFPFYSRNGTMTKDTWFTTHQQDKEFPEHFLKPLYKIKFIGITASAPNNYREFLKLKFGKGAIENPEYPDPKVLKFSRKYK